MARIYEDEEIPLALVRPSRRREVRVTHDEADELPDERPVAPSDRMGVGTSGGIAGLFAGAAALGVVHWLSPIMLNTSIVRAAARSCSGSSCRAGRRPGVLAGRGSGRAPAGRRLIPHHAPGDPGRH